MCKCLQCRISFNINRNEIQNYTQSIDIGNLSRQANLWMLYIVAFFITYLVLSDVWLARQQFCIKRFFEKLFSPFVSVFCKNMPSFAHMKVPAIFSQRNLTN